MGADDCEVALELAGGGPYGSERTTGALKRLELRSVLKYAGGKVTGTWEERNYNQAGTITGSADDQKMKLNIGTMARAE